MLFLFFFFFFFNDTATTEIYTLSLHDALPISLVWGTTPKALSIATHCHCLMAVVALTKTYSEPRSEEHTSELQSHSDLVCRLLLEKKKKEEVEAILTLGCTHLDYVVLDHVSRA